MIRDWGIPWYLGILFGLLLGVLIGAWQGFWTAYVGIPAFIVTLAGMLLFRGFNQFVGKSNTIPVPADFQYIGSGYLPEFGPDHRLQQPDPAAGPAPASPSSSSARSAPAGRPRLGRRGTRSLGDRPKLVLICGAIL